tara:strand:- start:404 stop:580 length:177 start_codon:yes stop_codon:yes gene_type:complete
MNIKAIEKARTKATNDRLKKMSKEELIKLIKEIKITCESNRNANNTFNFILRLIKGEL